MRMGGARPPPFITFTITSKVVVYAPTEWADTLTLFHLFVLCGLTSPPPTPNQRLEVSLLCVEYVVCDESLKNWYKKSQNFSKYPEFCIPFLFMHLHLGLLSSVCGALMS